MLLRGWDENTKIDGHLKRASFHRTSISFQNPLIHIQLEPALWIARTGEGILEL